jgi:hypothetical protein
MYKYIEIKVQFLCIENFGVLHIGTEIKGCPKLGTRITPQNLKETKLSSILFFFLFIFRKRKKLKAKRNSIPLKF